MRLTGRSIVWRDLHDPAPQGGCLLPRAPRGKRRPQPAPPADADVHQGNTRAVQALRLPSLSLVPGGAGSTLPALLAVATLAFPIAPALVRIAAFATLGPVVARFLRALAALRTAIHPPAAASCARCALHLR